MIHWQGNWKILFASGFSWLEAWINFVLDSCLLDWRNQFWISWRNQFCYLHFPILQLSLKYMVSNLACAFEGLDNVGLEVFRLILKQNYYDTE